MDGIAVFIYPSIFLDGNSFFSSTHATDSKFTNEVLANMFLQIGEVITF